MTLTVIDIKEHARR